jgi:hypothetical protein
LRRREVLGDRLRAGAAERAVQNGDAGVRERRPRLLLGGERQRGALDQEAADTWRLQQALPAPDDVLQCRHARQQRDDGLGTGCGERARGARAFAAGSLERADPFRQDVVADDAEAGLD